MTVYCELSELPEGQCACRVHGPREDRHGPADVKVFPARYAGTCDACRTDIEPGDPIAPAGPWGAYVHAGCS